MSLVRLGCGLAACLAFLTSFAAIAYLAAQAEGSFGRLPVASKRSP